MKWKQTITFAENIVSEHEYDNVSDALGHLWVMFNTDLYNLPLPQKITLVRMQP